MNNPLKNSAAVIAGSLFSLLGLGHSAKAADYTWTKDSSATQDWTDTANWLSGVVDTGPGTATDTLTFFQNSTTAFTSTGTNAITTNVPDLTMNVLTLNGKGNGGNFFNSVTIGTSANTWTLDGTTSTVNLNAVNGFRALTYNVASKIVLAQPTTTFTGNGSAVFNFNGAISGAGNGITKSGSSTLTLGGTNTYSGATLVSAGTLQLGTNGSIANTSSLTVNSGATFATNSQGAETGFLGSGAVVISGAGGVIGNVNDPNKLTTLNKANTYTGSTTISVRGGFAAGVASTYDGGGSQTSGAFGVNSAYVSTNQATLFLNGFSNQLGSLSGTTGNSGVIILGSAVASGRGSATLTTGGNNTSTSFAGIISDLNVSGNNSAASSAATTGGVLVKIGTGTQTLTGASAYSGGTVIKGGTLNVGNTVTAANYLGTGNVSVGDAITGGTLTLNASGIGALNIAGTNSSFTLNTGGTLSLDFASMSSYDQLLGTGTGIFFAINGGTIKLTGTVADGDTYQIFQNFTGSNVVGTFTFDTTGLTGFTNAPSLSNAGLLSFTAVPEPSTTGLVCVAALGLLIVMRRRRRMS